MSDKPVVINRFGRIHHKNFTLTKEIAVALIQKVERGENLFSAKELLLTIPQKDGSEKTMILRSATLHAWVSRYAVVPETGEMLRELLDQARAVFCNREREKRQERLINEAEKHFEYVAGVKTKEPVVGMFGLIKDKETGEVIMKENPSLLHEKTDVAKFALERLYPDRYGKVDRSMNKHLVFSLADLAKAVEEDERQKQNEV